MYRSINSQLEFFLIHPGGPFYKNTNEGVWSIAKGIPDENEDLLLAAQREFQEETGITPIGPFIELGQAKTKSGKIIHAWAFAGTWNESDGIKSNTFLLEWPPKSGKKKSCPEIDKAAWYKLDEARQKIIEGQASFINELKMKLDAGRS